jgi:hypothetical protein
MKPAVNTCLSRLAKNLIVSFSKIWNYVGTYLLCLVCVYRMSQKWRTNGALRCRKHYRKRQKNDKKILLDLFADLAVFKSGI